MVDREWLAGRGARRVAAGVGEAVPELLVIKYDSIPVVGNLDLVGLSHVRSCSVVAADPSCQPSPGVGADRQGCPVQSPEGLILPKEVLTHRSKTFLETSHAQPGEPALPPRPRDLRLLASAAAAGLRAGQVRSRSIFGSNLFVVGWWGSLLFLCAGVRPCSSYRRGSSSEGGSA